MTNSTEEVVACTASAQEKHHLHLLAALNILFSITASLGNILIFIALRKEPSLHPPSKLLFQCLAATDLCVGLFSQPLFAVELISIALQRLQLCYTVVKANDIAGRTLSAVSLSVDTDCDQRGQTSRFGAGIKIQTNSNFEANTWNCDLHLDCKHYSILHFTSLVALCDVLGHFCVDLHISNGLHFLLHYFLFESSPTSG